MPEKEPLVIIDGHPIQEEWHANVVTVARYGGDFNSIQAAIDYCDSIGGFWTIELYTYGIAAGWDEGDITPGGTAIITLRGMDAHVTIIPTVAPAIAVINITETMYLENITAIAPDATRPAVLVNTAIGAPTMSDCAIIGTGGGYSLQMTQGSLDVHRSSFSGDVHLSTARCLLDCYFTTFLGDLITAAEALNHDIDLMSCEMTGGSITSLATGATVIACEGVSAIDAITNSGTGLFTITDCYADSINCLGAGGIRIRGGTVNSITRAIGSVVWWLDDNTLKVIPSGTTTDPIIGHAITAATAGDVILIHPGTYGEAITCSPNVSLKGVGPPGSVKLEINAAIHITLATHADLENLWVYTVSTGGARTVFRDNGVAVNVRLKNIIYSAGGPGTATWQFISLTAASVIYAEDCDIAHSGNAPTMVMFQGSAGGYYYLKNNRCTIVNVLGWFLQSTAGAGTTFVCSGNEWIGTGKFINMTAPATITVDNDAIKCTATWTGITNYSMTLRNCGIECPITAGDGAIVRLKNCSYRAIQRTGTGNVVDESPQLQDAPWHVQKWTWQAALANSQVAVRGTPVDGGSGQVLLEVTLNAAGQEAVEQLLEAGGARDNSFLPVRTPRMITQFIWDRSGANQFVFFGLRETLGNAYPAAAEESAGFHYNSATGFIARSSTAAGDEDTVCTTPGHDAVIQLEVIIFGGVRVEFRIDGVLVATHTTRVPTASLNWQHLLYTDGLGGATDVDVEVLNGGCQQCPDSVPA